MQVKTVTIQIGNSDNKLTQTEWSHFCFFVDSAVKGWANEIYFHGFSVGDAPWQNACWVVSVDSNRTAQLKAALELTAEKFNQDSIAVTIGETEFAAHKTENSYINWNEPIEVVHQEFSHEIAVYEAKLLGDMITEHGRVVKIVEYHIEPASVCRGRIELFGSGFGGGLGFMSRMRVRNTITPSQPPDTSLRPSESQSQQCADDQDTERT